MLQIKKILMLVVMFVTIFSTCHADQVKISNINTEQFFQSMKNVLYSDDVQKKFPIEISDLVRGENDLTEYDLKVWSSFFNKKGAEKPDGEVTFYVDKDNFVHTVKITIMEGENSDTEYSNVFSAICKTIGFTEAEELKLFSGGKSEENAFYHSEVERDGKVFFVVKVIDSGVSRTIFAAGEE